MKGDTVVGTVVVYAHSVSQTNTDIQTRVYTHTYILIQTHRRETYERL